MIKKETIPVPQFKGLFLDGVTVPGGLSKAENIIILADGTAERRLYERTLSDSETCKQGRGSKELCELRKNDSTRYIFCDIDNADTAITSFGDELVTGASALASWTDVDDWALSTTTWVHDGSGVTALVGKPAVVATTKYRVVVGVTCASTSTDGNWAYTSVDSGSTWTDWGGNVNTVWLNKWTHTAGLTTALSALADFTPVAGASYSITIYVTQTSATGTLSVYLGGKLAGTISAIGAASHTFIVRFATDATALRFVPTTDWAGSIDKAWPSVPISGVVYWASVKKFIDPAGPDEPSNWDTTAGPHYPWYGYEMLNVQPSNWYTEVAANVSQWVVITLGGTACGTVTASGEYTYTVTAGTTEGLTFTPTTAWGGAITKASIMAVTETAGSKTKVIGGVVTGTSEVDLTWTDVLTDLTSGDTVQPRWAIMQDRAFRVDGTNKNYWFQDVSDYHYLGCPAPATMPTVASTTGGSIIADDYNVAYTYVKKYGTYIVEGNPSPAAYITIAGTAITCGVIGSTEKDISHIRIYRTLKDESGSYYYFDQETPNATKTVTLKNSDDDIGDGEVLEFNHDMPPKGKFILGGGSRLWLIDTSGTLHWSLLDQPEIMPAINYMTFDPKDGDPVMGMCALRKHLLVFKRYKTYLVDMFSESVADDGTVMLSKDVVSSVYGCVASGSICAAGTDSAIWLSHSGFLYYNGGTIRNISGGDGNMPSRIQSVVNTFMKNGAENFIDSLYHSERQLYHVNFLYRNSAGDTIVAQRHLVWSVISDTWTEYIYTSDAGARLYETCLTIAHDSLGREVMLVSYIDSTTGVVAYVFQGEYVPAAVNMITEILTATGDGVTAFTNPNDSFCDSSDNVYVITDSGSIFKISPAGTKSTIVNPTELAAALPVVNGEPLWMSDNYRSCKLIHVDRTNNCFYVFVTDDYEEFPVEYIVKISFTGTITQIVQILDWLGEEKTYADFYPTTSLLFYLKDDDPPTSNVELQKIASPGAGQTETTYYTLSNTYGSSDDHGYYYGLQIYSDDLYLLWTHSSYTNIQLIKFTTITGTSTPSLIDTGLNAGIYIPETFLIVSDTEIYISAIKVGEALYKFYKLVYAGGEWTATVGVSGKYIIQKTNNDFVVWGNDDSVAVYDSAWALKYIVSNDAVTGTTGISHLVSSTAAESIYILCGDTSTNVYKISKYEVDLEDTEPTTAGTIVHIISNYNDLGTPAEKRICRVYLPVESQYQTTGAFYLEPDYEVNETTHIDGEASEPSGSVSMRPFLHNGQETWTYTNSAFDSTVEAMKSIRLDVGTRGKAFRYAIRAGDVVGADHGMFRFKPPYIDVQILEKE
jgi:hypothetical protein